MYCEIKPFYFKPLTVCRQLWNVFSRWYELKSKPGKEKNKPRGELEIRVAFLVKAGSLTDLSSKPHKSSMGQLSHMAQSVGKRQIGELLCGVACVVICLALQTLHCVSGGSLLSIASLEKKKGLKKLAKNLGKFCANSSM